MVYTPKNLKAMGCPHGRLLWPPYRLKFQHPLTRTHSGYSTHKWKNLFFIPYPHVPHIQRKMSRATKKPNLKGAGTIAKLHHN